MAIQYNTGAVLQFIISRQNPNGSFSTHEQYPVVRPGEGWLVLPDSSPFITANILCALLSLNSPALWPVIQNGCKFLQACMEHNGYWRFWPVMAKQHPIPLDMDDTSVAGYVLEKAGMPVNNKAVMYNNCNKQGNYYTWFIPTPANLTKHPATALYFLKACLQGLPTRLIKFYTYTDSEPAVAANVLLYLGQNKNTAGAITRLIADIQSGKFRMQFYHDEIMVYYHISRAYSAGVGRLEELKNCIVERIGYRLATAPGSMDELLLLMCANIFLNYNCEYRKADELVMRVTEAAVYPDKWIALPYFSSENRNFLAGSPEFVAALFVEAAEKLNRLAAGL
jgi:hypothetical protein